MKVKLIGNYEGLMLEDEKDFIKEGNFVNAVNFRGFGKTTLLKEIAEELKYKVIEPSFLVEDLNRKYNTDIFVSCDNISKGKNHKYLLEDYVDYFSLPKHIRDNVIGGFSGYTQQAFDKTLELEKQLENKKHEEEFDIVQEMKDNSKLLSKKIKDNILKGNDGTVKNLTNSLGCMLKIIDDYDWKLKYSEYITDGKKQIAVWEQNGEGQIRNHKIWDVKTDIEIFGKEFFEELKKHI